MPISVARLRHNLQKFDFRTLFIEELGWDRHSRNLSIQVDGTTYSLEAVAEKRGFQVFACCADGIPDSGIRQKIERQTTKSAHEHIIIFTDSKKTVQKWQWVRRERGKPPVIRPYDFFKGGTGELLVQKLQLLAFDLSQEENLTLPDVLRPVQAAFDVDRVTKRFYERFKAEHARFLALIKGITAVGDREWYASLMLNRLMFIYFIQKKRFLDDDLHYLRNRLQATQERKGKDKFLSFYRYFLLRLFHEGLAKPAPDRKKDLDALLGDIPYLNGGLFEVHELEQANPDIQISDEAFKRLFDFFDAYEWHLDDRPLRSDHEINPDVLGYIFEKYINQKQMGQKQMGAYYTKEDITGYISRNTVIPFLFDAAEKKCAIALRPDGAVWRLLQDDPDRYIYPAMLKGIDIDLPAEITAGVNDLSKRGAWNKPADSDFGLPTETWREHVARRQRCAEIRRKLQAGEVHSINDLITYNLDICRFATDVIRTCEGPELLLALYKAIKSISILDPTCGSGAFLFAALSILEPLYHASLDKMQGFVDDLLRSAEKPHPKKFKEFRDTLAEVGHHPSRRYFILKSIIINNLYGVDHMEEAVEICKLRLFLKLVAQVEKVKQLEPLPDIDFNIRPGNTLVGFASLEEVKKTLEGTLGFGKKHVERIAEDADIVDRKFRMFREMQTTYGMDANRFNQSKIELRKDLDELRAKLDKYLAGEYGVPPETPAFQKWQEDHLPFHWLAEFYGIMHGGGFDVIIGNPPWREYAAVKKEYTVRAYTTEGCGNLHCLCTERSLRIRHPAGRMSFIVQLPMMSSSRMATVRRLLSGESRVLHVIPFDDRPGKLFEGLQNCRSVIFLSEAGKPANDGALATARYQRWASEVRQDLRADASRSQLIIRSPLFLSSARA